MANPTLSMILSDARKLVASKQASSKQAAIAGTAPESIPGSEHDSKVPDEAKQPQKYIKDETMVPNSGLKAEGAGKKDIADEHALTSEQAAEEPNKKPLDTDDANAKEAADATAGLANDILSLIRGAQKTASAAGAAKKVLEVAEHPAAKKVLEVAEHPAVTHGAAGAGGAGATAIAMKHHDKKASELNMELTTDVMAKVAALILSTEEGAELAEKQAAFEAGQHDAQALIDQQIYQAGFVAAQKQAQAQSFHKLGQAAADASMADMMGGTGGDAGAESPVPTGDADGGEGAGDEISIEDVTAALEALVAEGKVQPEEAQAVLQYLTEGEGAAGGEAAPGAAPKVAPKVAPEAAPEAAPEDVNKAASAGLLAAIRQLKAQK